MKSTPPPIAPAVLQAAGSRVLLRPVTPRDAKELVALHHASRKHLGRWTPPTLTVAEFRKNFVQWTRPGNLRFVICLREDGRIIGDLALSQIFFSRLRSAYMGYSLGAPYAGHGYMQEALQIAMRYAFRTLKLNRIEANIQPSNRTSIAVAQRMGFSLEGYSRRYLKIANGWRDHQRWALLASDWKPSRKIRVSAAPANDDGIEIRDLVLRDIATFAVLRHRLSVEGHFLLAEPAEAADKEKFAGQVMDALNSPDTRRILAFDRGRLIGFVKGVRGDSRRIRHSVNLGIGIVDGYAGRGIGKRLMDAIEAWARSMGARRLDLRVMVHNERGISLYLRCGFCIEGRVRGEYCIDDKLVDAYIMGKILD